MRRTLLAFFAVPVAIAGALVATAPAQAATQPLFGTTVDVTLLPSGYSLLGGTAYAPSSGGAVQVTLGSALAANVDFQLLDGATVIASCTVPSGGTTCATGVAALPAGPHSVTASFTQLSSTVTYTGTLFTVQNVAPTVRIEWQDATGTWIDGSGVGIPFFGPIAARCTVTNNGNAAFTFTSFTSTVVVSGVPTTNPIVGSVAAGATAYFPIWSGPATAAPSANCGGSVTFPDTTGNGSGNGGGVIPVGGTITATPSPAPGTTVIVSAANLVAAAASSYTVAIDGVEVAGPFTTSGPDFAFSTSVAIPSGLAPGAHSLTVYAQYGGLDIAFANFPFTVDGPALAATGGDAAAPAIAGTALVALGALLLLAYRRRRTA